MDKTTKMVIEQLLRVLLSILTPEVLSKALDSLLDSVENAVIESENTWDNTVVLPLCKLTRKTLHIPD